MLWNLNLVMYHNHIDFYSMQKYALMAVCMPLF